MRNKRNHYLNAILILLFMLSLVFTGCPEKEVKKEEEPFTVPVLVQKPDFKEFREYLEFPGSTDTPLVTQVAFMASGAIENLYFDVGDPVKKGDLLGRLDQRQYADNVKSAEAQVGYANANYVKALAGSRPQEIKIAKANMLQAEESMNFAKKEMERYKKVYQEDAISEQQYSSMLSQYKVAVEQYEAARKQYHMIVEGNRVEDIDIARSNINVASASLQSANTQLAYTVLYSPVTGTITKKLAEVGSMVNASAPVFEIQSSQALDFTLYIPAIHMPKINLGSEANVSFYSKPDKIIKAKVREIQPLSDQATKSFRVKLKLQEAPTLKNLSGEIGKATFYLGASHRGIYLPLASLRKEDDGKGYFIFYVDEKNVAHKAYVKVLTIKDQQVKIEAVLPKDCRVVISGQEYLKENQLCKIITSLDSYKYVTPDKEAEPIKPSNKL